MILRWVFLRLLGPRRRCPACAAFFLFLSGKMLFHQGGLASTAASTRELPQWRQNLRVGSLPVPHCPQTSSPGLGAVIVVCAGRGATRRCCCCPGSSPGVKAWVVAGFGTWPGAGVGAGAAPHRDDEGVGAGVGVAPPQPAGPPP